MVLSMTAENETTTTMTPIDGPAWVDQPDVDPVETCIVDGVRYEDFEYAIDVEPDGTTDFGVLGCVLTGGDSIAPPTTIEASVAVREPIPTPTELPSTGPDTLTAVLLAAAATLVVAGSFLMRALK